MLQDLRSVDGNEEPEKKVCHISILAIRSQVARALFEHPLQIMYLSIQFAVRVTGAEVHSIIFPGSR